MSVSVVLTSTIGVDKKYRYRLPNGVVTSVVVPFKGIQTVHFSGEAELAAFKNQTIDYTSGENPELIISDKAEVAKAKRVNAVGSKEKAKAVEDAMKKAGADAEDAAGEKGIKIETDIEKVSR